MKTLNGDLALMSFEQLLIWAEEGHKSGFLTLTNGCKVKEIYFRDGKIVFCSATGLGQLLEEALVNTGLVDPGRLEEVAQQDRAAGLSVAESLLEARIVPQQELEQVLVEVVATALYEALAWQSGTFDFAQDLPAQVAVTPVALEVQDVLRRARADGAETAVEPNDEEQELISQIGQRVLDGNFDLPPMPDSMMKIHQRLNDQQSSVPQVVELIAADQILTSKILKAANSAFYSLANPVTSVRHAIVCMGFKAIQGLVVAQTLSSIFVRNREAVRRTLHHGFQCAHGARKIALAVGANPEEAFVCGLLHNIGKSVLLNLCNDYDLSRQTAEDVADRFHQQVGVLLAAKWNLPEMVIETIEFFRTPAKADSFGPLVEIVYLVNGLLLSPEMLTTLKYNCRHLDFDKIDLEKLQGELAQANELGSSLL